MPGAAEPAARFRRFAAIDWSGAKGTRHRGIAVAVCEGDGAPALVAPPGGGAWSRAGVLDWLLARADEPLLAGFDFSFAAPFADRGAHLPGEAAEPDARALWAHVDAASDDVDLGAAGFVAARRGRHFWCGAADGPKAGYLRWRVCEAQGQRRKPSTVFDCVGAAQVAKASWAGMRLLHRLDGRVAVWPFDPVPPAGACVVEIYTAIAARAAGLPPGRSKLRSPAALAAALAALGSSAPAMLERADDHATDALLAAAWLRASVGDAGLWRAAAMTPAVAAAEGWTFGVP